MFSDNYTAAVAIYLFQHLDFGGIVDLKFEIDLDRETAVFQNIIRHSFEVDYLKTGPLFVGLMLLVASNVYFRSFLNSN